MINIVHRRSVRILLVVAAFSLTAREAEAIPYFARKYDVRCSQCHSFPPVLNEFGQRFVSSGYKLPELPPAATTLPLAIWVSHRAEIDAERGRAKAYPNRIELISADSLLPWFAYFVEWRTLSYQTTSSQRLLGRHGRFEDLFLQFALAQRLSITAGQFRMLNQWDVSRRLSLSEPAAFSAAVGGSPTLDPRLSSVRGFSFAGRAPALRATLQTRPGSSAADGWFHEFTLPFSGELSLPLGEEAERNASFALEGRPKGLVYETYYRRGLTSLGAALFVGDERWVSNLTGILQAGRHSLMASAGTARFREGRQDFRLTVGDIWIPNPWFASGIRLDHQSGTGRRPAVLPHINFNFPGSKYTLLLTFEQRIQPDNHGSFIEFGTVF